MLVVTFNFLLLCFFLFLSERLKTGEMRKNIFLTSQSHQNHPFTGQNTQQSVNLKISR